MIVHCSLPCIPYKMQLQVMRALATSHHLKGPQLELDVKKGDDGLKVSIVRLEALEVSQYVWLPCSLQAGNLGQQVQSIAEQKAVHCLKQCEAQAGVPPAMSLRPFDADGTRFGLMPGPSSDHRSSCNHIPPEHEKPINEHHLFWPLLSPSTGSAYLSAFRPGAM